MGQLARPGDTLIIAVGRQITRQGAHDLMEHIKLGCPNLGVVVCEATQIVVYRPDSWDLLGA